ncbi:MAG TPA: aminotransferase class V-fold PLP-dependent enzyme [Falsiroseomonas sp.]|jgi:selenocysteine lyase/cysteine desulfurase|nr:aminotransferase class V-fold PLP-dependent enzyme [Falsiroseomonas sp.]
MPACFLCPDRASLAAERNPARHAVPLFDPAAFRIPPGAVHVCAGGETPVLRAQAAALERHAEDKSMGPASRPRLDDEADRLRARLAAFWSVAAEEIGLVSSVAEGMSILVESLDWQPGDNVVLATDEYPSVVAPLALRRGVELRFADMMDPEAVAAAVDARTRMIVVSAVSMVDGRRHDLAALRAVADGAGAMLVVDFTQASGWLPLEAAVTDFAFSACYKWMLGITGIAVAYWNRARQPGWAPTTAGWYSVLMVGRPDYAQPLALRPDARRFTRGNPCHGGVYAMHAAMDLLETYPRGAVQRHVQGLTVGLLDRLAAAGIASTTPRDPMRHGANVCIAHERAAAIVEAMAARGVLAWNGRGRVRFSFHGYNDAAELDRIMDTLRASL